METMRINKYLSGLGICSRREADRLLSEGRITVDGKPAEPGLQVTGEERIEIDGKIAGGPEKAAPVVLAFNKPKGIVCTTSEKDRAENIVDYINYGSRIYPVGRLDKDSRGLILLTNRGELVNLINRAGNRHEKEYRVTCSKPVTEEFLNKMSRGVRIEVPSRETDPRTGEKVLKPVVTQKCRVSRIDTYTFDIVIVQGLNRQIRRMCKALGNRVEELERVRVMNICLGDLPEGKYRVIEGKELSGLEQELFRERN